MAENKVVIRINYDKDKAKFMPATPKLVTIWHTRRIITVLLSLVLIISIPIIWWSQSQENARSQQQQASNNIDFHQSNGIDKPSNNAATVANSPIAIKPDQLSPANLAAEFKLLSAIIFDKKVIRASLNTELKDNEPFAQMKKIIRIVPNKSLELFYFTQVRDFSDKVLFHNWTKDGKTIYKKQLDIKGSNAKAVTSKKVFYKDKGQWQIQLVDKKSRVLSEVNFEIMTE